MVNLVAVLVTQLTASAGAVLLENDAVDAAYSCNSRALMLARLSVRTLSSDFSL